MPIFVFCPLKLGSLVKFWIEQVAIVIQDLSEVSFSIIDEPGCRIMVPIWQAMNWKTYKLKCFQHTNLSLTRVDPSSDPSPYSHEIQNSLDVETPIVPLSARNSHSFS